MNERPQHTYYCQCKGHSSGGTGFSAAPPEWFKQKGLSEPKWCPACREWRDAQEDEAVRCAECGDGVRLPRSFKVGYHRHKGPFKRPEKCKLCEAGKRAKGKAKRVLRRPAKLKANPNFEELPKTVNTSVELVLDISDYKRVRRDKDTDQQHIEHHIPGHPNSNVGQILPGRSKPQSPTSLVSHGASFAEQLVAADKVARAATVEGVRQYAVGHNRILKAVPHGDNRVEIVIINLDGSPFGAKLVTAYDNVPLAEFKLKVQHNAL